MLTAAGVRMTKTSSLLGQVDQPTKPSSGHQQSDVIGQQPLMTSSWLARFTVVSAVTSLTGRRLKWHAIIVYYAKWQQTYHRPTCMHKSHKYCTHRQLQTNTRVSCGTVFVIMPCSLCCFRCKFVSTETAN